MARLDRCGLPLSTTSDLAAERYRDGVDLLLSAWPAVAEALEAAVAADPDFALAHAAQARLHALRAEPAEARARIAAAVDPAALRVQQAAGAFVALLAAVAAAEPAVASGGALRPLGDGVRTAAGTLPPPCSRFPGRNPTRPTVANDLG
jgi:hypothetical protein